jgi:3-methyladenine DNA glycosylase AlkD
MPTTFSEIQKRVRREADAQTALRLRRFFKTGPGQYGENDAFLGIRVPDLRRLASSFFDVPAAVFPRLLASSYHEERMLALLLMIRRFECGDGKIQENIFRLYLAHTDRINSWDLVDISAPPIVGAYLHGRDNTPSRILPDRIGYGIAASALCPPSMISAAGILIPLYLYRRLCCRMPKI